MNDVLRQSIWVMLWGSLPVLVVAMVVGLLVGVLQTATSIQEQTISFIPKIVAVLLSMILFSSFVFGQVTDFTIFLLGNLHRFVQ